MAKRIEPEPMPDFRPVYELTAAVLQKQEEVLDLVRSLSELKRHPTRDLRPFKCTQEEFDRLPGLVSRCVFTYWTGLSDGDLSAEVTAKQIEVYKPNPSGRALYYKREIARLAKFKL